MEWLNYHHLLYFWVVAKEGSLARASQELRLAHPTISGQIHRLEEALGEQLFTRQGRNLVLTEMGRVAFRYADEIFSLVAIPEDRIDAADRQLAGRILFAAKEAVYKAAYPLDREVLGYEDIGVDLKAGRATTTTGRSVSLVYCTAPRVVVLAFVEGDRV